MKTFYFAEILILLTLLLPQPSFALEEEIGNFRGIRSAGMGGLITTTGNYSEALFGNPARHSEVDTWKLAMMDATFEVNSTLLSTNSQLANVRGASGSGTISAASNLIGKNEHALIQLLPGYYNPHFIGDLGFGFGILVAAHTNLDIHYTTDIDTQTFIDAGPNFGFSYPLLDNTLSLGMNFHILYRVATDGTQSSLNFLTGGKLSLQNFGENGLGVDTDLGAYYHVPIEFSFTRISVGASLNNLLKSHYNDFGIQLVKNMGTNTPYNDRLLNFGTRFDFPDFWIFTAPLLAIELQDVGDTQKQMSIPTRTHIGGEAKLSRALALRLGLNQGYWAAGFGIDLPVVKIDLASYGEELTGVAGGEEDRRYMIRLAFEL